MTNPTLSIVLYCYNRTKWLDECLASLITQDLAACEVVIVDSSTSDAVEAWFADRAPLTTPFRHFRNRKSGDPTTNWIAGAGSAIGTYFMTLHDDDTLEPGCVQRIVQSLEATAERPHVVFGLVGELGSSRMLHRGDLGSSAFDLPSDVSKRVDLLLDRKIATPVSGFAIDRTLLLQRGIDPASGALYDLDILGTIAFDPQIRVRCVPTRVGNWRRSDTQLTAEEFRTTSGVLNLYQGFIANAPGTSRWMLRRKRHRLLVRFVRSCASNRKWKWAAGLVLVTLCPPARRALPSTWPGHPTKTSW